MAYVDGFVLAVPKHKKEAYIDVAKLCAMVFKEHGALSVVENWGHDIPDGKHTSFPLAVKCGQDETVVFSWIVWPSKKVRDEGVQKSMGDSRMQSLGPDSMPFDGKRMILGGFNTIVDM